MTTTSTTAVKADLAAPTKNKEKFPAPTLVGAFFLLIFLFMRQKLSKLETDAELFFHYEKAYKENFVVFDTSGVSLVVGSLA